MRKNPKKKKDSREEMLRKKRIAEKKRREKIKSDPVKTEEVRRYQHEQYLRRKAEGKIISLNEMPARARRMKQKRNKINFKNYYEKHKHKKELDKLPDEDGKQREVSPSILTENHLPCSSPRKSRINPQVNKHVPQPSLRNLRSRTSCLQENHEDSVEETEAELQQRHLPCSSQTESLATRQDNKQVSQPSLRNLRSRPSCLQEIHDDSVEETEVELQQSHLPCSSQTESLATRRANKQVLQHSLRNLGLRKSCLQETHDDSIEKTQAENIFLMQQTSSPMPCTSPLPHVSPGVSTIHSPIPSSAPNSPRSDVSINSNILKKEVNLQLRKYQKKKSLEISMLKQTILKINKEKEVYRKRLERLQQVLKTSCKSKLISHQNVAIKPKKRQSPKAKLIRNLVKKFYEDDENSRISPGKQDCITRNGLKKQKRYLVDSLKNLHRKYMESGSPPISYVTFTRLKPFWVIQPKIDSRDTCLCKPHANMDLLIFSLKKNKIIRENSTTEVINSLTCENAKIECLQRKCQECKNKWILYEEFDNSQTIVYYSWEKSTKTYIKNNIEKTAFIVEKVRKDKKPIEVLQHFEKELGPFMNHCANIKNQYESFKKIKQSINEYECVVHMDFSENYSTKYSSEIQAVHFGASRTQITLHTAVIYYRVKSEIKSQAFCTVSESLRHDASAVWAHLVPILQEIEANVPHISILHLISDSPSAQYRNKKVFYIMSQLRAYLPDLSRVIWHYCECGHGKGAPDGVGGVLKRSADRLVAFGKDIIDIESLVQGLQSIKGVKIKIVYDYEVNEKDWLLPKDLKSFPGSMKIHQIVWAEISASLAMRSLSCTDENCLYNAVRCIHGKHLGFYELPIETQNRAMDFPPTIQSSSHNTDSSSKRRSIQNLKSRNLHNDTPNKSAEFSYDMDNIDYNNPIPSVSFFENINSDIMSKFEKTIVDNSLQIDGTKKIVSLYNIFDSDDEDIF